MELAFAFLVESVQGGLAFGLERESPAGFFPILDGLGGDGGGVGELGASHSEFLAQLGDVSRGWLEGGDFLFCGFFNDLLGCFFRSFFWSARGRRFGGVIEFNAEDVTERIGGDGAAAVPA